MSRLHLFEIEDQTWCPQALRDGLTDYLAFVGNLSARPYEEFAEDLAQVMKAQNEDTLINLGAGAGGPMPTLLDALAAKDRPCRGVLTDLHPNRARFEWLAAKDPRITFDTDAIDATKVPSELHGVRIMLNTFHHLTPTDARAVLKNAVESRETIAVFEAVERSVPAIVSMFFLPLVMWIVTPFIRPLSLTRLLLTYTLILPLCGMFDGIVSCLRIYDPKELRALTEGLSEDYEWKIERRRAGPGRVTYLIGSPRL